MLVDYIYGKVILGAFMLVCAVDDARKRTINPLIFAVMFLLSIGGYAWMLLTGKEVLWLRVGCGLMVGGLVWLVSFLTREQIGYGDAIFFILTGLVLGCRNVLFVLGTVLVSAMVALCLLVINMIRKKRVKNESYPLLPIALPVGMAVMLFAC